MSLPKYHYIKTTHITGFKYINIESSADFLFLIQNFKVKLIFINKRSDSSKPNNTTFSFVQDDIIYSLNSQGFDTLEELQECQNLQILPEVYLLYKTSQFEDYQSYAKSIEDGFKTKEDYDLAHGLQFPKLQKELHQLYKEQKIERPVFDAFNKKKVGDLFYTIFQDYKYPDLPTFKEVIQKGFIHYEVYLDAKSKGFESYLPYKEAKKMGFESYEAFQKAKEMGLDTKQKYDYYKELGHLQNEHKTTTIEQAHILYLLQKIGFGKKIALSKLWELLEDAKGIFVMQVQANNNIFYKLPNWYTCKFANEKDLRKFMSLKIISTAFGNFDKEGDIFEKTKATLLNENPVIIDGSNVAWHGKNREAGEKPSMQQIIMVLDTLKARGFSDVTCLVDAALEHQVDDSKLFVDLDKKQVIKKVPSKSVADTYIIKYAKENNALIVTNDTFKDWSNKDKWLKEHLGNFRIDYMILDEVVKFGSLLE